MKIGFLLLPLLLVGFAAQTKELLATPDQEAMCKPDVRRFCYKLPKDAGDSGFLACLQEHRAKLSAKCRDLLESHGQ